MTSAAADARYNPPRYQSATGSASQPLQLRHSRRHIVSGLRGSTGLDKVTSNEIGTAEGLIASISRRGGDQVGDTIERQLTIEDKEKGLLEEVWVPDDEWYPEGGWRAWKVVLGCFIFACCQMGYGMVWGVLVVSMRQTPLFENVPLSILNLVVGLCNVSSLGLSFFTGRLGERFGYKLMLLIGASVMYLAFILSAVAVHSLVASFFFQGLFIGVGAAIGMPLFMSLPAQWFKKRRGLATGITVSGTGFGGAISNLIFRGLLPRLGYHNALLIWGSINFFMTIVAWFLLEVRKRPVKEGSEPASDRWLPEGMLRDIAFYFLLAGLFLGNFGFLSPFYFITSYTKLHCPEIDPNSLVIAVPLVVATFSSGIGRIGAGFLADRLGPVNAMCLTWVLGGLFQILLWPYAKSFGSIIAFGALYGITGTWFLSLLPVCCAQLFGVYGLATITGASVMATAPGQFVGSTIGGIILTRAGGNYSPVAYYSGAMMLAAGGAMISARFTRQPRVFARF